MAESILLHFRSASRDAVAAAVAGLARPTAAEPGAWRYPADDDDYTLTLAMYDDPLAEYEPADVDRLRAELGGLPATSLAVELRRSRGGRAADDATAVVRHLLRRLDGVVDDTYSELWRLAEIDAGVVKRDGAFLACYRHPRPAR